MTGLIARIRAFYDPAREPLRVRVYTSLILIATVVASAGLIAGSLAVTIAGPLALVLAIPAVESARAKVSPVASYGRHADRTP